MIDQATAMEHIRSTLAAATGRPFYVAAVGTDTDLPYGILYPLPVMLRPVRPLDTEDIWRIELQLTSVGRNLVDAGWLDSKANDAMDTIAPPAGHAGIGVEGTVGPVNGTSTGVSTIVRRWAVAI